jgi:hypothetical protein
MQTNRRPYLQQCVLVMVRWILKHSCLFCPCGNSPRLRSRQVPTR